MLLVLSPTVFGVRPPLLLQLTASEPRGVYWLRALPDHLTRGMLVTLRVPAHVSPWVYDQGWLPRSWMGAEVVLVKPIAALPGDRFCVNDQGVSINDIWQGPVYRQANGVTLPELRGCWPVQEGQVLLLSTKLLGSFDGRYMGVVAQDALLQQAVPLWIWEN